MEDTETTYPRLTYTVKLNQDLMTVRGETGDQMKEGARDLAEAAGELATAGVAIKNAFGITEKALASDPGKEEVTYTNTTQKKNFTRTVKPGAKQSGDVPSCACGIPMNDVRGKTYQKGPKAGQPYPASFYPDRSCQAGCKPIE